LQVRRLAVELDAVRLDAVAIGGQADLRHGPEGIEP
jgi:hypothetical protein